MVWMKGGMYGDLHMPEKHSCEECGARMQQDAHGKWFCPKVELLPEKHNTIESTLNLLYRVSHGKRGHS